MPDEIVRVPVDDLTPWPGNARVGNSPKLRESILANGVYKPILAQKSSGRIIVGNNTFAEIRRLGHTAVDVIYKDIDDVSAQRIMLADNRTSDVSGYDDGLLYSALLTMDDLTGTGWSLEDVEALMRSVAMEMPDEADLGEMPGGEEGDGGVLILDDVRTGADWAELPQQTDARAERQAAQVTSAVKGTREIMLVYVDADHREMIRLLEGLKKLAGAGANNAQIVQSLVRQAARAAGLV